MTGGGKPPEEIAEVVSVARGAVEREFQISERLDAKARGLVTLAGQWFAVVQAVSAVAYTTRGAQEWLIWCVGGAAILGGIALGATFVLGWRVWRIRDEESVSPGGLGQMKSSALSERETMPQLVDHYAVILRERRNTNTTRSNALTHTQRIWFVAMAIPLFQLGFALATRLFV